MMLPKEDGKKEYVIPSQRTFSSNCFTFANHKPECTISETNNEAGASVLMCKADGFPTKINFTWSKDNETLDDEFDMDSENDDYSVYILPAAATERYGLYVCIAINDVGVSKPCERMVSGPGLAGWHAEFGDKNVLVIAAIIASICRLSEKMTRHKQWDIVDDCTKYFVQ
ncbi:b-cell receptor CD22 [Caerostris darwini]|uniref:B-cell receptor CD22 n=1 Tax=Caerostris darwini TaxID=1538125 RepID=A0AAV4VBG0_9ARAC|nr:b-cell receptor CD22 [Caerostris darwini]